MQVATLIFAVKESTFPSSMTTDIIMEMSVLQLLYWKNRPTGNFSNCFFDSRSLTDQCFLGNTACFILFFE